MKLTELTMNDYFIKMDKKECLKLSALLIKHGVCFKCNYSNEDRSYSIQITDDNKAKIKSIILKKGE